MGLLWQHYEHVTNMFIHVTNMFIVSRQGVTKRVWEILGTLVRTKVFVQSPPLVLGEATISWVVATSSVIVIVGQKSVTQVTFSGDHLRAKRFFATPLR
eukprot:COSAG02_NODE_3177_length_7225_cov_253.074797_4_plen_99_part_00